MRPLDGADYSYQPFHRACGFQKTDSFRNKAQSIKFVQGQALGW
jgi:hypothetical protein